MKLKPGYILFFVFAILSLNTFSQRIVSLAPSLTKMLYILEAEEKLVGCTNYCIEAIKDKKSIVITGMEINTEKIYTLKPDWVITTDLTKPTDIAALKKIGLKVKVMPSPKSYTQICEQLTELARLTNKQSKAKSIIDQQQARLDRLKSLIPKDKKPKVFYEIGAKPLFTVIPNTFMDDFITYSGGQNIAADLKQGTITREAVVLRNPDFIFIVTMGVVGDEEKAAWLKYSNISAVKKHKIFIVDSDKACSPDPVSFVDVVEQLIKTMYP
ncbi:MAG TPA: helical backbone metal receptor [Bacteroidales bacterium]|nr:helical backbone metal receptor [Bacteroidales bacterium]